MSLWLQRLDSNSFTLLGPYLLCGGVQFKSLPISQPLQILKMTVFLLSHMSLILYQVAGNSKHAKNVWSTSISLLNSQSWSVRKEGTLWKCEISISFNTFCINFRAKWLKFRHKFWLRADSIKVTLEYLFGALGSSF